MTYMDWIELGLNVLTGLTVAIPTIIALVKFIQAATKEKNWSKLLHLALGYMETAEEEIENGSDRKEWVLAMVRKSAATINYDYDDEAEAKIAMLIDSVCSAAKKINK